MANGKRILLAGNNLLLLRLDISPRTANYVREMQEWHLQQVVRANAEDPACAPFLLPFGNFQQITPSARLIYEPIKMAHAEEIIVHFADDPNPFTDPRFRDINYLLPYLADMELRMPFRKEGAGMDYVFRLHNGAFAGIFHFYHVGTVAEALHGQVFSIGYLVAPGQRGRGLAAEAIEYACLNLKTWFPWIETIRAFTDEYNQISRAVLAKLGFVLHAEAEEEGDELEYQMAVEDLIG